MPVLHPILLMLVYCWHSVNHSILSYHFYSVHQPTGNLHLSKLCSSTICFFKILFIFRERGKREREICEMWELHWCCLSCARTGPWPTTQACDLIRNQIIDLLVSHLGLGPLSHTSQCLNSVYYRVCFILFFYFTLTLANSYGPMEWTHIITLTLNITGSRTTDLVEVELLQIILHSLTSLVGKVLQEAICGRIAVHPIFFVFHLTLVSLLCWGHQHCHTFWPSNV